MAWGLTSLRRSVCLPAELKSKIDKSGSAWNPWIKLLEPAPKSEEVEKSRNRAGPAWIELPEPWPTSKEVEKSNSWRGPGWAWI